LPTAVGLLGGTVSLIGGQGTAIAWSPRIREEYGVENAGEIGIACATFGLILASLMGGPIAKFVTCLFAGIVLTNILKPRLIPKLTGFPWPSRTPAMALIAEISLGTFLAMSLMSMQLWTLIDLAGPIFAILAAQCIVAVLVNLFIVFPAMGKSYDAAVISSGFGGISLGSTPTAMANMSAVTQRFGPSRIAFIVVPLVCAFFIDLANALMIPVFLGSPGLARMLAGGITRRKVASLECIRVSKLSSCGGLVYSDPPCPIPLRIFRS